MVVGFHEVGLSLSDLLVIPGNKATDALFLQSSEELHRATPLVWGWDTKEKLGVISWYLI